MPMKFGYARGSTKDQSLQLQLDALNSYGCDEIFQEAASGAKTKRKELNKLLTMLRAGDVLVVYKLDRLGRSLKHLVEMITSFKEHEIALSALTIP